MKVNFKRNFSTGTRRYRVQDNPCSIPDEWLGKLPKDAEIVEPPKPKKESGKGKSKGKAVHEAKSAATKGAPPNGAKD
jgi:hypothetical protein